MIDNTTFIRKERRDYDNRPYIEYVDFNEHSVFSTELYTYSEICTDDFYSLQDYYLYYNKHSDLFRFFIDDKCIEYYKKDMEFDLTEEWYFQMQLIHDPRVVDFFCIFNMLLQSDIEYMLLNISNYTEICDFLRLKP